MAHWKFNSLRVTWIGPGREAVLRTQCGDRASPRVVSLGANPKDTEVPEIGEELATALYLVVSLLTSSGNREPTLKNVTAGAAQAYSGVRTVRVTGSRGVVGRCVPTRRRRGLPGWLRRSPASSYRSDSWVVALATRWKLLVDSVAIWSCFAAIPSAFPRLR